MDTVKEIQLTQGKVAIVDDEDFERLNQFKWRAGWDRYNWYATRNVRTDGKRKKICMHREILNARSGILVDHINGNGLDNRRGNIRLCNSQQNSFNRILPRKNSRLGIKGVCWHKGSRKFQAQIGVGGRVIYLGLFTVLADADQTYRVAELKYFGEFARNAAERRRETL